MKTKDTLIGIVLAYAGFKILKAATAHQVPVATGYNFAGRPESVLDATDETWKNVAIPLMMVV